MMLFPDICTASSVCMYRLLHFTRWWQQLYKVNGTYCNDMYHIGTDKCHQRVRAALVLFSASRVYVCVCVHTCHLRSVLCFCPLVACLTSHPPPLALYNFMYSIIHSTDCLVLKGQLLPMVAALALKLRWQISYLAIHSHLIFHNHPFNDAQCEMSGHTLIMCLWVSTIKFELNIDLQLVNMIYLYGRLHMYTVKAGC